MEGRLMKRWKKGLAIALASVFVFSAIGCGSKEAGELNDGAASRAVGDHAGEIYIDDEAAALAGSFAEEDVALIQMAQAAVDATNAERAALGLSTLVVDPQLTEAAYVRAQEIVSVFSHTRPNGSDWWTVNSNVMYGENLAKNFNSAADVTAAWMASPTHRANIATADYVTIGIAIYRGTDGRLYWAQEFGY
jgi:uncharacterized protein YkwD